MLTKILNILNPLRQQVKKQSKDIDQLKLNSGRVLSELNNLKTEQILSNIQQAEFKIFSQWGDDGIINFLCNYLDIPTTTFIEFGVEDYTECNTRFLLINNNWRGLIMDGSKNNMDKVRQEDIYWRYNLTAVDIFVTKENINNLLQQNNFTGETGLLHIDIDGNDYWIWKEINVINPVIVIIEYNSVFGSTNPWTIPYDAAFYRTNAHHSNLYYGTSLLSACDLAKEKGYSFIGCNSNGNNAYFVRNDKVKNLTIKSPEEGFADAQFAESRSASKELTFLRGDDRLKLLKGMPVFNTRTNTAEVI
jgi:hypothetical protein